MTHLDIYGRNPPSLGYYEHSPAFQVGLCEFGTKRKINVHIEMCTKHTRKVETIDKKGIEIG
jgi:hypothetical protein